MEEEVKKEKDQHEYPTPYAKDIPVLQKARDQSDGSSLSILKEIETNKKEVELRRRRLVELLGEVEESVREKNGLSLSPELIVLARDINSKVVKLRSSYLRSVFEYEPGEYLKNLLIEHSINVAFLSLVIGLKMDYDEDDLFHIFMGGILHDIGMFRINPKIINKPAELNLHEKKLLSVHPIEGAKLFEKAVGSNNDLITRPDLISMIISQEHERVNGNGGYPYKLKEGELHPFAMILGFADTFESLTHPRPYREQLAPFQAFRRLFLDNEERHLFSRGIRKACFTSITAYPPGTIVNLDTGDRATVIDTDTKNPLTPVILLRRVGSDNMKIYPRVIDLRKNNRIHINHNGIYPLEKK